MLGDNINPLRAILVDEVAFMCAELWEYKTKRLNGESASLPYLEYVNSMDKLLWRTGLGRISKDLSMGDRLDPHTEAVLEAEGEKRDNQTKKEDKEDERRGDDPSEAV